ncbi:type II secretion system protein GspC [Desulfococcus sp.]|uniref:type II secretion system protein GspC n=1 Tax=Desulfococcus sp. TaxID=2025834 RepID=UPI0035940A3A
MPAEKPLTVIINLVFMTMVVYLGVNIFYKGVASKMDVIQIQRSQTAPEPWQASAPARPIGDYDAIGKRNIFKTADPAASGSAETKPPADVSELKETELNLKLWGTVSGEGEKTYAVIEDQQKRIQNLYRENDSIMGATVKRIMREKVVLTVGGKDEVLAMEKTGSGELPAGRSLPAPSLPFPPVSGDATEDSQQRLSLSRQTVNEAMGDINGLMDQAKIRPHFRNGKPDGLTISRIRRDSIFSQLGLRSGDIITGVDGQAIESVDDALKFYNQLKSSSNVNLQIRRRGMPKQIEYTIE